jgi:hypothetical protein
MNTSHEDGRVEVDRVEVGDAAWLDAFAMLLRRAVLSNGFPRHTCVLTTRLGLDVLRYFGVRAEPEPVAIACYNAKAFQAVVDGTFTADVGYTVGVGGTGAHTTRPGGISTVDLHLVLRTLSEPRLVDLSIDQFHRPERDLHLNGALVTPVFDLSRWLADDPITVFPAAGGAIRYDRLDDHGYRRVPDWHPKGALATGIVAATIRALRELQESGARTAPKHR